MNSDMPLNKYLAHSGVASRREAVQLVVAGSVRVNGELVKEPGYRVKAKDQVELRGMPVRAEKKIYLLLNKPRDCVATCRDERGRRTVLSLLAGHVRQRVYPVGRLDRGTTGLLLLTNDGALAQMLAHPKYEVEKRYSVTLDRPLAGDDGVRIKRGVRLVDGVVRVDALHRSVKRGDEVTIVLHSGKNRVVRRLFERLGYRVAKLDRIAYAGLSPRELPRGAWRPLTVAEIDRLRGSGADCC